MLEFGRGHGRQSEKARGGIGGRAPVLIGCPTRGDGLRAALRDPRCRRPARDHQTARRSARPGIRR
jgi:hypothetical protein